MRNVGWIVKCTAYWQLMGYLVTPCDPHILLHSFDRAMNHRWGVSALAVMQPHPFLYPPLLYIAQHLSLPPQKTH